MKIQESNNFTFDPSIVSSELKHSAIKIDVTVAEKQAMAMLLSNSQK